MCNYLTINQNKNRIPENKNLLKENVRRNLKNTIITLSSLYKTEKFKVIKRNNKDEPKVFLLKENVTGNWIKMLSTQWRKLAFYYSYLLFIL